MDRISFDGPVVLVVMDGVGLAPGGPGNAISNAHMPFLSKAISSSYLRVKLEASGESVGLLKGVMGNSEVGHNTIGSGQIIKSGIAAIEEAFDSGSIWQSEAWQGVINQINTHPGATLHFAGIFSDGAVHSDINQLEKMIKKAYDEGIRKIRVHCMFDGRDVPPQSEPKYIERFELFAEKFLDADIKIASGGGRMTTTCDRYENDWGVVERGFNMMVHGIAQNTFHSATEAIAELRAKTPGIQDQYLPDFVIVDNSNNPIGKVSSGDAFVYFDFRADRAVEIATALSENDFTKFNRGNNFITSEIYFAGLTEYQSDKHIPKNQLIKPNYITHPLNEFLNSRQITELAVSETVKFGHITYYFNGNSYDESSLEKSIEIPSYTEPFNTRPWMKTAEITDAVLANMDQYKFVKVNFPGGDMVGHFAEMDSCIIAMEAIDLALSEIAKKVDELGGCLIITADHGNVEELLDEHGEPKTAHSLNPVPFIIYDNTKNREHYSFSGVEHPGLANIAATIAMLLGQNDYPEIWQKSLIVIK